MYYEIASSIFSAIYLVVGALLIVRRNNPQISKRSPWLVNICHWSNIIEIILILPTATDFVVQENPSDTLLDLRDSGIMITHFLVYYTYILRGYRLYNIYQVSQYENSSLYLYKTTQKWAVKLLIILMFPVLMVAAIILSYPDIGKYFPVSDGDTYTQENAASCVYVSVCFLEQLFMITIVYKLRFLEDDYNMNNELICVCLLWFISPFFSAFINTYRNLWLVCIVIRNSLLFIRSSLIPVIKSFESYKFVEPLTIDMMNSLEILLQNPKSLVYFENFLLFSRPGQLILEFYQKCECQLSRKNKSLYASINSYLSSDSFPSEILIDKIDTEEQLLYARDLAYEFLNKNFYADFLSSEKGQELRKVILKSQVFTDHIRMTSLHRNSHSASSQANIEYSKSSQKLAEVL
jgi:hypothetical protein